MDKKSKKLRCMLAMAVFAILAAFPGAAQAISSPKLTPAAGPNDLGLVFSSSNILLGLESYQAGIGIKAEWNNFALRLLADLAAIGSTQSYSLAVGLAAENHFIAGAISPYYGAFGRLEAGLQLNATGLVSLTGGGIIGVEVFVFDFLSIFAEYSLAADVGLAVDLTSWAMTFDWNIDAKMGNNSMLGIVVYYQRSKK